jgi:hypothetical protein
MHKNILPTLLVHLDEWDKPGKYPAHESRAQAPRCAMVSLGESIERGR